GVGGRPRGRGVGRDRGEQPRRGGLLRGLRLQPGEDLVVGHVRRPGGRIVLGGRQQSLQDGGPQRAREKRLELALEPGGVGAEGVRRGRYHSVLACGGEGSASGAVKRVPVQPSAAAPVGPRRCLATTSVRAVEAGAGACASTSTPSAAYSISPLSLPKPTRSRGSRSSVQVSAW